MPTLFDKVDQFWRGVGEPHTAAMAASSSRPPLPPSLKSSRSSSNSNKEHRVTGRPPIPSPNGKFDRNRRCYSSLSLNKSSSKLSSMGGSIVDIYEFCKSQASKKLSYQSLGKLKSKSKSNIFSGSTTSVCGYPCIKEEVLVDKPDKNLNEINNTNTKYVNDSENTKTTFVESQHIVQHHQATLNGDEESYESNVE